MQTRISYPWAGGNGSKGSATLSIAHFESYTITLFNAEPAHSKETGVLDAHATAALLTFYTAAEAAEREREKRKTKTIKHYYSNKKLLQEHCKSNPHINAEYEYFQ